MFELTTVGTSLSQSPAWHLTVQDRTIETSSASTISPFRQVVTRLRKHARSITASSDPFFNATLSKLVNDALNETARHNGQLLRAEARLVFLANLDVSKNFEMSHRPSAQTVREAGILIRKIVILGSDFIMPTIGLDNDGNIIFSFASQLHKVFGSVTIYGDETYSYSIERGSLIAEDGSALIADPISSAFRESIKVT